PGARFQPRLEALEQRLAPTVYFWTGGGGSNLWSNNGNWNLGGGGGHHAPYGDPSALLVFSHEDAPLDPIHDFTAPTTIQEISLAVDGYSLSAAPGASVITLTGGIEDDSGGTSTINLPLYFSANLHDFSVFEGDTLELTGSGNLSGPGLIH